MLQFLLKELILIKLFYLKELLDDNRQLIKTTC